MSDSNTNGSLGRIIVAIGLLASCIGIFVFVTGWESVWEIFQGIPHPLQPTEFVQPQPTNTSPISSIDTAEAIPTFTSSAGNIKQTGFGDEIISAIVGNFSEIYVGTLGFQHEVFRSSDSGETWKAVNNGLGNLDVWNLVMDSSGNLFAGSQDGLWVSRNKGDTWLVCDNKMNTINPPYTEILASTTNPADGSVWVIVGSQISGGKFFARSTNSCSSWETLDGPDVVFLFPPIRIIVAPSQPYWVFVLAVGSAQATNAVLWRSDDNGASWLEMATIGAAYDVFDMAISWGKPRMLFAGTRMGVYRSDDGGYSWQPVNNGLPNQGHELIIESVLTHPLCNDCVFVATQNELFYTEDAGGAWSRIGTIPTLMTATLLWAGQRNPTTLYLGTSGNGLGTSGNGLWKFDVP